MQCIDFSELPTEYEREFHKQIWILRNLHKLLPNSAEARRRMQKLKQVEKSRQSGRDFCAY